MSPFHLINTDDHSGNMAALGALGNRISSDNVIPLGKGRAGERCSQSSDSYAIL